MNKIANKKYDYKGKKEKWPIRPTGHPKNLVPTIRYKLNELTNDNQEKTYTITTVYTAQDMIGYIYIYLYIIQFKFDLYSMMHQ